MTRKYIPYENVMRDAIADLHARTIADPDSPSSHVEAAKAALMSDVEGLDEQTIAKMPVWLRAEWLRVIDVVLAWHRGEDIGDSMPPRPSYYTPPSGLIS